MLLLVNVWFWILLVTEFKLLEVPVTLQHSETVGCNWVLFRYGCTHAYACARDVFTHFFLILVHQVCTGTICCVGVIRNIDADCIEQL